LIHFFRHHQIMANPAAAAAAAKAPKTVGKYELYHTLGEGSFGKVKYAICTETKEACAIKILDKEQIQKNNMGQQIKKEISIMKLISHTNVVCVKDVFATSTKIFIVLELVDGGELFDKIQQQGRLTEEQARYYVRQLCEGLEHCHSRGVCHRDLKPEVRLLFLCSLLLLSTTDVIFPPRTCSWTRVAR